jgi:predicted nucleic acid-binding protein
VYLDTTVPSAYYDAHAPDRQRLTREFWAERLPYFRATISDIVISEIRDTPDVGKRMEMEKLVSELEVLDFNEEAYDLAQEYIKRGIFPEKYESDANHVAVAVINGIGYFASWNFRHLVKVNTRLAVNLVNALKGYGQMEIIAPPEL